MNEEKQNENEKEKAEKNLRSKQYIKTATVVSSVRNETRTCRRKSTDYRFARRIRMHGQHPVNSEDIVVTPTLANNSVYIGDDRSVIVLAREWGIRLLCNAERVCVDGTFRSAPVTHFQMLSFHVLCKNGSSFPVVHVLLKDKRFASYVKVLDEIQRYTTGLHLGPVFGRKELTVTTDFESAFIKALKHTGASIHGCHFHFCQALWRFVHTHGLSTKYVTDSLFRTSVRSLMALPFLRERDIARSFLEMKTSTTDDDAILVYEYFERTWINGFGTTLICQYGELFRTNNNAEAFHSSLRRFFFAAHPQFYVFVEKMNDLMDTVTTEWEAERLRPKRLDPRSSRSFENIRNVVDNFYNDSTLRLPLRELLRRIGEILHEDVRYEEAYEDGREAMFEFVDEDFCADGVPMEIDECHDESHEESVTFRNWLVV